MNTKRKIKDYKDKKVAIHCSSKEEWDKIVDLFDSPTVKKHHWEDVVNLGKSDTINITGRGRSPKEYFIKKQYTIYPASDFLEEEKSFKFEEGKWYSFNWDWYSSNSPVIAKIKKVFGNSINVSWRSYLWEENNYDTSDTYLFKDISNIKELSIEQVQPYLPEGHPDKFKVETPITKAENHTSFKVGGYITIIDTVINKSEFIGDVLKITEIIDEGKNYGLWFKHIPESFSGGGFRYNAYKDKIRQSTPEEVKNSLIVSQYPLTTKQCFEAKPLIKNRNPVVKETIKNRNRLEIKPIKQTIKLKHYVNI